MTHNCCPNTMVSSLLIPCFAVIIVGALSQFDLPQKPTALSPTLIEGIQSYARIYFWDTKCIYFQAGNRTLDAMIASIAPRLGKLLVPWDAIKAVGMRRFCRGLVILAEDNEAVSAVMRRAVEVNWSLKVLALVQSKNLDVKDHTSDFTQLRSKKFLNFNQRKMNISAFNCPLFVIFKRKSKDGRPASLKDIDGVEFRIFLEIARQFNFSWNLNVPPGDDKWGMPRVNESAVPFGMMKMLMDRGIELSICSWWLEVAKLAYIDYSTQWQTVCATFLLPKPTPYIIQWTCFVRPFAIEVWVMLILTFCCFICLYWMNFDGDFKVKPVVTFDESVLTIWGMLLMNDGNNPEGKGNRKFNRVLLTFWGTFALIIVSAYSGSLAARLTLPEFEPMIHTPEQLARSNYPLTSFYQVFESQYTVFPFIHVYEYRQKLGFQISLSLFFLQSAFVVLFCGNVTGLVAFFAEIYKNKKEEQKIRDVLRPDLTRRCQLAQLQKWDTGTRISKWGLLRKDLDKCQ